jgi:DNA topoisomerase-2
MKNMKFDSQTKERITNPRGEVSGLFANVKFDKLAQGIMKNDALIMPIIQAQLAKQMAADARAATLAEKAIQSKKVEKHIPATGRIASAKTLFITEGDSAIGPFISARTQDLAKIYGGYPLRGKIPNITGMTTTEILKTKELGDLINILNLKIGQKASEPDYGTIAIMTDQDIDGFSIQGLLLNFFWLWPDLYYQNRIKIVRTPLYVATKKDERKYFYDKADYDAAAGGLKGYEIRYIKGLGSLRKAEYKDILASPVMIAVQIDDPALFDAMYGAYNKFGDARKKLIGDV